MRARKSRRREFTPEFRAEAVHLMNDRLREGVALAQIGRDLDLEPDLLRRWARQLGLWGTAAEKRREQPPGELTGPELEAEVRRLRRELDVVRQERDFLKKATAFFAKESQ
jgi:transposase